MSSEFPNAAHIKAREAVDTDKCHRLLVSGHLNSSEREKPMPLHGTLSKAILDDLDAFGWKAVRTTWKTWFEGYGGEYVDEEHHGYLFTMK